MSNNSIIAIGAYVKGVFDASAPSGTLSQAAALTMVTELLSIYGDSDFSMGFDIRPKVPIRIEARIGRKEAEKAAGLKVEGQTPEENEKTREKEWQKERKQHELNQRGKRDDRRIKDAEDVVNGMKKSKQGRSSLERDDAN